MAINLSKKSDNNENSNLDKESYYADYDKYDETSASEKFSNIDLKILKENKRIFIPYSELPQNDEQRCSYLEELTAFLEQKTGKHYSYFLVSETEPYEVSGFYIQLAPELKDKNGEYVNNNDYVYDEYGTKWHVTYYYKNNLPCILIDNDIAGYTIIYNLSEFSLNPNEFWADDEDLKKYTTEEIKNNDSETFDVVSVIAAIIFGIVVIVVVVLFTTYFSEVIDEFLSNMLNESANTQTGDETTFMNALKNVMATVKPIYSRLLPICFMIILLNIAFKILKRIMRGE